MINDKISPFPLRYFYHYTNSPYLSVCSQTAMIEWVYYFLIDSQSLSDGTGLYSPVKVVSLCIIKCFGDTNI